VGQSSCLALSRRVFLVPTDAASSPSRGQVVAAIQLIQQSLAQSITCCKSKFGQSFTPERPRKTFPAESRRLYLEYRDRLYIMLEHRRTTKADPSKTSETIIKQPTAGRRSTISLSMDVSSKKEGGLRIMTNGSPRFSRPSLWIFVFAPLMGLVTLFWQRPDSPSFLLPAATSRTRTRGTLTQSSRNGPLETWTQREADPNPMGGVEDAYSGAYKFVDSPVCAQSNCTIYFPDTTSTAASTSANGDKKQQSSAAPTICWDNNTLCMMTKRGSKGHYVPNQDRTSVITGPDWCLASLFDGHGDLGHVTSQIAVSELPVKLAKQIQTTTTTKSIQDHLLDDLFHKSYLETDAGQMSKFSAGTTALTVLQMNRLVYMASAGDSTAWLVQWLGTKSGNGDDASEQRIPPPPPPAAEPWYRQLFPNPRRDAVNAAPPGEADLPYKILLASVKHKPGDPKEKARIEAAGGEVFIPLNPQQSSRVVYPVAAERNMNGMVMQMALAMSRSLGDTDGKKLGVVIADPDVVFTDMNDHLVASTNDGDDNSQKSGHFFLVLASDGVTDMVKEYDIISLLGRALYEKGADSGPSLSRTMQSIIEKASGQWGRETGYAYRDDISLTVKKIELVS